MRLLSLVGWTGGFQAGVRERLCDSDGNTCPQSRLNCGVVYYSPLAL
jgi:hypothetical protein